MDYEREFAKAPGGWDSDNPVERFRSSSHVRRGGNYGGIYGGIELLSPNDVNILCW
jgi:hypothetical protein